MKEVAAAVAAARARLRAADVPGAERDAMALLDFTDVGGAEHLTTAQTRAYEDAVTRRVRREPVSRILGRRSFWMHEFRVTPDVLDPRPDTETLVEVALSIRAEILRDPERWSQEETLDWPPVRFRRVLDLGTGSGCILMSFLHEEPAATGVGTDISEAALAVAADNAGIAEVSDRVSLIRSDWLTAVTGTFDLIVSNPPYIAASEMAGLAPEVRDWEPHLALTPGGDGLDAYRIIARDAPAHLTPGGHLMVEIGAGQGAAVRALMEGAGLVRVAVRPDINGKDRVVTAEKQRSY